eukprot:CAMPEP_0197011566 /NCGR_PEP_ID=MMETSP1380-20130617/59079_1 /TAXON_ID=5936 /ORGANISM="Euplotes crassus, Strain CT5" /LENGTH=118 /DNA_ID=CAMNT_0042434377 /DNA_START=2855 /DNA_END=3211 /DNA_ORIENTATION=-
MVNGLLIALFCIAMSIKDVVTTIVKKCKSKEEEDKSSRKESLTSIPNESIDKRSQFNEERAPRRNKSPIRKRSEDVLIEEFKIGPKFAQRSQGQAEDSSAANSDIMTKMRISHTRDEH